MDPTTNKCVVSRDVIFDEISSHDSADINKEENNMITLPLSHFSEDISKENQGEKESLCPNQDDGSQEEITNQRPRRNIVRPSRYRDDNFFSYAKRLIEKFGLIDGKKRSTPLDVNTRLRRDEGTCLSDPRPFRTLVGSLIYLTITRPDIAFSVGMVSRYMQEPRKPHFEEAKKILKYVNSTLNLGLLYEKGVEFSLQGFADADFGSGLT
ncbi:hypothetical protein ZIOFF_021640 [Zingiber officinale]|uniref:Reverse transcriptase n=1 Tax=Zingiber officinale TaxID=94328 RepID=A0A8J5L8R7_ZINOF|nr:hypothetical protein ZIOFF_021640 [Zingiber officinale]